MTLPISQRISRAKTQLILNHPILGSLIIKVNAIPDKKKYIKKTKDIEIPFIMSINLTHMTMHYNEENLSQFDDTSLEFILAHEAMHILTGSLIRRQGRLKNRWNVATDLEINWVLKDMGFTITSTWLYKPEFHKDHLIAEQIYDLLSQDQDKGENEEDDEDSEWIDLEEPEDADAEREATINQQSAMVAATQMMNDISNKGDAGSIPEVIRRLLKSMTESKVRWQDYFMTVVSGINRDDFSYRRCLPGFIPKNIYLPTLYSPTTKALVIVDTSGSIGNKELQLFMGEVKSMLWMFNVSFISCDANVGEVVEDAKNIEEILQALVGGGGTSFAPAFKWIENNIHEPINVVLMTDGYNGDDYIERPQVVQNLIILTTTGTHPTGIEGDVVLHISPGGAKN